MKLTALFPLATAALLCLASAPASQAQTVTLRVLHTLDGANDGDDPEGALLRGSGGILYGTASDGGAHRDGTVFAVAGDGSLTVLHAFSAGSGNGTNSDGAYPYGGLVTDGVGDYFCTASDGGTGGSGTIFEISSNGTFYTLYSFGTLLFDPTTGEGPGVNKDGATPQGTLVLDGDNGLFGITSGGGDYGFGTIFKFVSDGPLTVLHTFTGPDDNGHNADGYQPADTLLLASDGNFYGVAGAGGGTGNGTLFKVTSAGTFTTLHNFGSLDVSGDNAGGAKP